MNYKAYVDPKSGDSSEATEKQLAEEPDQILVIEGIQAFVPPPIWIGEYNGEMLFYPWKLVSILGSDWLNIKVGGTTIRTIVNVGYDKHIMTIEKGPHYYKKEIKNLVEGIKTLRNE